MKNLLNYLLIVLVFGMVACKATNESEDRRIKNNRQNIEKLKEKYPVLSQILDSKLQEADKIYSEADKISDEKLKVEKKQEANAIFNTQFMRDLGAIEYKVSSLEKELKAMGKKKYPKSELKKVNKALEDGYKLISDIDSDMTNGGSEDELAKVLRKRTSELISMDGTVKLLSKEGNDGKK